MAVLKVHSSDELSVIQKVQKLKMKPKTSSSFASLWALFVIISSAAVTAQTQNEYRLCVPQKNLQLCKQMVTDANTQKVSCVGANDKVDCIEKVVKDEADFLPLEPEEIYVAQKYKKDGFSVITEIRSKDFPNRDFRYEPIVVVRRSSEITSVSDLRGKRSCHTGFGRNAGWKTPFSHLMELNQLPKLCDEIKAPTPERDLFAVSKYFSAACAPGSWIPDSVKDKELKEKYPNLCQLCKDPSSCKRDDEYGGYEGALKCLTMMNGDVAWTKMDSVENFFKIKDSQPDPQAKDYAFLCRDGSSQPLTSPDPCSWAKRPWRAILASSRLSPDLIQDLQAEISHFKNVSEVTEKVANIVPTWLKSVLEFEDTDIPYNVPSHEAKLKTPAIYLEVGKNYTVTIEKPSCATNTAVKLCVRSEIEKSKCMALSRASMGQRILPKIECVLGENDLDCIQKVHKGDADVVTLGAKDASWAGRNYQLVTILSELEDTSVIKDSGGGKDRGKEPWRYAVAVVRVDSATTYRNISDLRGKRSCHGSINSLAGWNSPMKMLRDLGAISGQTCSLAVEMSKFFGNQSCVPGIRQLSIDKRMDWLPVNNLCSLCAGDGTAPGKAINKNTVCIAEGDERYYGDIGALRCLQDKVADVAFLDHVGLLVTPLGDINKDELRLLCPTGKLMELTHVEHCNWGKVPSGKVVARGGDDNAVQREDARLTLLKAADTFSPGAKSEVVLKLFGTYFGNRDLIFKDSSVGLCDEDVAKKDTDESLINDFDYCTTGGGSLVRAPGVVLSILVGVFLTYLVSK